MKGSCKVGQASVGVAAAQLTSTSRQLIEGVTVKALSTNTATIFVGMDSGVTTSTGYELSPAQSVFIRTSDVSLIWTISGSASQTACWIET